MYKSISQNIIKVLPENWEVVSLYSHVEENMFDIFFFVKKNNEFVNCFQMESKFGITRKSVMSCFEDIYRILLPDYKEKKWYSTTIVLNKEGAMTLTYDYEDHSEDEFVYKREWKDRYLK